MRIRPSSKKSAARRKEREYEAAGKRSGGREETAHSLYEPFNRNSLHKSFPVPSFPLNHENEVGRSDSASSEESYGSIHLLDPHAASDTKHH